MRELVLTPKFKRTFRKFVLRNPQRQKAIEKTLAQMREDIYFLSLGTHSLRGELSGLKACSCGYDCRIIFSIKIEPDTQEEVIILLDIGTHGEVY
ncbi:type II toxin-antitoxin system mRNA interferase toxin, RelE/StbE family [Microcystis flos-aquae FACHB-1344]|uniref:Type II toxin-antitoxin system mRNA interferase toxin, RelE/StbE family n=1 Tax=Microcystis flos-aquae FACHB-1344 TaxID=2692899 RepID=A0ABR8I1N1_9CHRO|nr:type II toxin-antitoxin system mRNA interferase toxin, RelE/StbE family [Microcystis flos-aquae]MBD2624822.1 type II toxin-antitoxin system mRNA interferase toxin, RelE/StbE family [Microcystis flos-aquae FACHB-1344]